MKWKRRLEEGKLGILSSDQNANSLAVVVAQLAERSLSNHRSAVQIQSSANFKLTICCKLYWKDENKRKRGRDRLNFIWKGKHNTEKSRSNSAPNAPSTEKLKNQIQPRADKIEGRNLFFHYIRSMTPLFYFYWGNAHSLRWLIRSRTLSLFSKVWQKLGVCVIERESLNACLRAIHRYRVWAVVGIKRSKKLPKKKHKHF